MAFFKSAETYYAEMTSTMNDVDISEHSLIYNSLMPCCYELSYQSLMLDEATKMVFAKTALDNGYSSYLELRCAEQGLTKKAVSTAAGTIKVTGVIGYTFPSGALVSTSLGISYTTDSALTLTAEYGYVNITASGTGSSYNADIGDINTIPVKYEGISSVTNETAITDGYDEETDEELYDRYLIKVQTPVTSGNEYHYLNWSLSVDGCGGARITSLWNGNGTVKVTIINSNKVGADAALINSVKAYIEANRPVGATVTVISAIEKAININATLTIDTNNYTLATVKASIITNITNYLKEIAFKQTYVSYAQIGSIILGTTGVKDYSNLTINSGTSNITIANSEVAVIGSVVV